MGARSTRVAAMRRRDSGAVWPVRGLPLAPAQVDEVVDVLLAARRLLVGQEFPRPQEVVDHTSARAVLAAVWEAAVATVTVAATGAGSAVSREIVGLLHVVKEVDERIVVSQVRHREAAFQCVRDALTSLAQAPSSTALLDLGPEMASTLGFDRAIVSRVEDSLWTPERVHVESDSRWAAEILEVGRAQPQLLDGSLLETEMVRRRTSLLVDEVQGRPGVNRPIADASMSRSYSAAPIVVDDAVVGLVHADCYYQQRNCDETDRQVLSLYAQGLGQALSRTMVLDRVAGLRSEMTDLARRFSEAAGAPTTGAWPAEPLPVRLPGPPPERAAADDRPAPVTGTGRPLRIDPNLTRREVEVLRHLADGDTNVRIARRLVISEATVKSHVKSILRKLGVANRAEAVSVWLRRDREG